MQIYKADDVFGEGEGICVRRQRAKDKNPHTHEFIELIYICKGDGIQIVNGVEYPVQVGDMLFVNFRESHAFKFSDMEFIHILLRPEFISEVLVNSENIFDVFALAQFSDMPGEFRNTEIVSFYGEENVHVFELIQRMLVEYNEKKPGYRVLLQGYTQVLFTLLIRKLKEKDDKNNATNAKIVQYVDSHLAEHITLSDIAIDCFYNPSYFSRKFKSLFGKSFSVYVKERRLKKAAQMLVESDISIEEVCMSVGFSDKTKFYNAFKARYSITPGEYRKGKR